MAWSRLRGEFSVGVGTKDQNIGTEGKGFSVPLIKTGKGAEELNAKGCSPPNPGKKAERRNAVTDVEGQGAANPKPTRGSSWQENDVPGIKHSNCKPL